MSALRKTLLAAAAVFALAPTAGLARPPPCFQACTGPSTCEMSCTLEIWTTTCRGAGLCGIETDADASPNGSAGQGEDLAAVCIDESQGEWQPGPASIVCRNIKDSYLCTIKGCDWDFEASICL